MSGPNPDLDDAHIGALLDRIAANQRKIDASRREMEANQRKIDTAIAAIGNVADGLKEVSSRIGALSARVGTLKQLPQPPNEDADSAKLRPVNSSFLPNVKSTSKRVLALLRDRGGVMRINEVCHALFERPDENLKLRVSLALSRHAKFGRLKRVKLGVYRIPLPRDTTGPRVLEPLLTDTLKGLVVLDITEHPGTTAFDVSVRLDRYSARAECGVLFGTGYVVRDQSRPYRYTVAAGVTFIPGGR